MTRIERLALRLCPAAGSAFVRTNHAGIGVRVVDMHTLKPLDADEIRAAAAETGAILTVEEHNVIGGLGSAVAEILVECERIPFRRHGIHDDYALIGPPAALYAHYQLDAAGIATVARELLQA